MLVHLQRFCTSNSSLIHAIADIEFLKTKQICEGVPRLAPPMHGKILHALLKVHSQYLPGSSYRNIWLQRFLQYNLLNNVANIHKFQHEKLKRKQLCERV